MDYSFSDEQKTMLSSFERFCKERIEPKAEVLDRDKDYNLLVDNLRELAGLGFLSAVIPQEYEGSGLDYVTYMAMGEHLAKVCASTYLSAMAHTLLCANFIRLFGTEEQKRKYLIPLARGEAIGGLCVTEPTGGSDLAALKTKAERVGDKYVLNGVKSFVTNGPVADILVVLARVPVDEERKKKRHAGITAFIVEKDWIKAGEPYDKLGARGSPTSDIYLDDTEVPTQNVIGGKEDEGFKQVMRVFEIGRVGMAIYCLGIAAACLEESVKYAREREAFEKKIAYFEDVNFKIADIKVAVDTARDIILKAAWLHDIGDPKAGLIASVSRLYISELIVKIASDAVQIFGGTGYVKGVKVERLYRDAKLGQIGEGTDEIQRRIIFRKMMQEYNFW